MIQIAPFLKQVPEARGIRCRLEAARPRIGSDERSRARAEDLIRHQPQSRGAEC
jgi:hypothetical protein